MTREVGGPEAGGPGVLGSRGPGSPVYIICEWKSHNFTSFYRETNNYVWNLPRVLIVM
jgi:hypothetical protein